MTYQLTLACIGPNSHDFIPENNLRIPISNGFIQEHMTEETFNNIINNVISQYKDEVSKFGADLKVEKRWTDEKVNAYAHRMNSKNVWEIVMFGGMARHPLLTEDGFALIVCHELGHHLGGAPKRIPENPIEEIFKDKIIWASNEGQSDYWATLKCFRKVFKDKDNFAFLQEQVVDDEMFALCDKSFSSKEESALCLRSLIASKNLSKVLTSLSSPDAEIYPKISTPDPKEVTTTFQKHSEAQCRLDTLLAGTICHEVLSSNVSDKNPNIGTCNRSNGDDFGVRPLCWFRPKDSITPL